MKILTQSEHLISVDALRIGMFIHLDLSWMRHPFPLSSFRIANDEQLATIRGLGLEQVRWRPAQSDVPAVLELPATAAADIPADAAAPAANDAVPPSASDAAPVSAPNASSASAAVVSIAASADALARQARRRALATQAVAQATCERQFVEAAQAFDALVADVPNRPESARNDAEQLVRALTDKMIGADEVRIRLLQDGGDDRAATHALNVAVLSLLMGRAFGLPDADLQDLGVGALLHDIGQLDLPERVRHPSPHFSAVELRSHEQHVAHGVRQARRMGLTPGATLAIAQHHESGDGSGYPLGLNIDRMSAVARIVSLVDRYDELCNPRDADDALTPHEAVSLLFAQGRATCDTAILGAFIRMMGVYPAGSMVQLTDDRYAMVVGVNSSRPLKPSVLVHDAGVPREQALVLDLEDIAGLGIRRSVKPLHLPAASMEYLEPQPRVSYFFEAIGVPRAAEPTTDPADRVAALAA